MKTNEMTKRYTIKCEWCGIEIETLRSTQRFCCPQHGQAWYYKRRRELQAIGEGMKAQLAPLPWPPKLPQ